MWFAWLLLCSSPRYCLRFAVRLNNRPANSLLHSSWLIRSRNNGEMTLLYTKLTAGVCACVKFEFHIFTFMYRVFSPAGLLFVWNFPFWLWISLKIKEWYSYLAILLFANHLIHKNLMAGLSIEQTVEGRESLLQFSNLFMLLNLFRLFLMFVCERCSGKFMQCNLYIYIYRHKCCKYIRVHI